MDTCVRMHACTLRAHTLACVHTHPPTHPPTHTHRCVIGKRAFGVQVEVAFGRDAGTGIVTRTSSGRSTLSPPSERLMLVSVRESKLVCWHSVGCVYFMGIMVTAGPNPSSGPVQTVPPVVHPSSDVDSNPVDDVAMPATVGSGL